MVNETIQARVNPELKAQAEAIFAMLGLKTSDAIRMFLQQSVNCGGLPFAPRIKQPNTTTQAAIQELAESGGERFESTGALFASWDALEDDD